MAFLITAIKQLTPPLLWAAEERQNLRADVDHKASPRSWFHATQGLCVLWQLWEARWEHTAMTDGCCWFTWKGELEADDQGSLAAPHIPLIIDCDETLSLHTFMINLLNLQERWCALKHLHICTSVYKGKAQKPRPFKSGRFLIEILLLIYSLCCNIQKNSRIQSVSCCEETEGLTSVSEISILRHIRFVCSRELSVVVCRTSMRGL